MDFSDIRDIRRAGGMFEKASRVFVGPHEAVIPLKTPPAVAQVVALLTDGPKTAQEMADSLGVSRDAVCKRIFRARRAGWVIKLNSMGLYWMDRNERICRKCGKRLAKLNKGDTCFNYPDCG